MRTSVEELRRNLALFIAFTLGFELDDETVLAVQDIVKNLGEKGVEYLTEVIKNYRSDCTKLEKNLKLDLLRYVAKRAGVDDWFAYKYAIYEDTPEFRILRDLLPSLK
jgi:hypothetical protein